MRTPGRTWKSLYQHPAFELESVLLEATAAPPSGDELRQRLAGALQDRLSVVTLWPPAAFGEEWWPGDFASLRLSFGPPGDAERVVVVRAEPMEPVCLEVSLRGSRGVRPALPARIHDALVARGFREQPEGRGWVMRREVDAPADEAGCGPLAHDVAALLVDVLGYAGQVPLSEHLVRGEAGELKAQVTSITPAQVRQLVVASGLGDAVIAPSRGDDAPPALTVRTAAGGWLEIRLLAPASPGRFGALDCTAVIEGVGPLTVAMLAEVNARLFACAVCQQGPVVMLRGGCALYAGVAMASVLAFLQHMATQLEFLRPLLAGRSVSGGSMTH